MVMIDAVLKYFAWYALAKGTFKDGVLTVPLTGEVREMKLTMSISRADNGRI